MWVIKEIVALIIVDISYKEGDVYVRVGVDVSGQTL